MRFVRTSAAIVAAGLLAACGGGGGAGGTPGGGTPGGTQQKAGIAVPTEISALPAKGAGGAALRSRALSVAAVPAESDYALAPSVKFVDERTLSRFDILNTIFKALAQTRYADPANVGAGPYGAVVTWEESHGDSQAKRLVPWVVDSSLVTVSGREANRVKVWMEMPTGGGIQQLIKVQVDVFSAPSQRADGSYADYGEWRIDAKLGEDASRFFTATATRAPGGGSIVTVNETEQEGATRGIMRRSEASGYGKVTYPDWSACSSPDCVAQPVTAVYAYDAAHAAVKKGASPATFKDRGNVVDIVHRYGLFDATTGEDVNRTRAFGFPVRWTAGGAEHYAYYGAWQGRHQLWSNGDPVAAGTVVRRGDRGEAQAAESYTASPVFVGTLVKRTLVPADVQDVRGLVVETWVNETRLLRFDAGAWAECASPNFTAHPTTCASLDPVADFSPFAFDPNDDRRHVHMSTWNQAQQRPQPIVYLAAGPSGAGFYLAADGGNGPQPTATPFAPAPGQELWVNVSGSVYVTFDGSAWVQKKVASFDATTWTPTFDPAGDRPFDFEIGRELYVNNPGANYVVKRTGANAYDARIELQSVANPVNAAAFAAPGTVFRAQWAGTGSSTFEFVTDPGPDFLKLVYKTVGSEAPAGTAAGDVVTSGQWGLVAYDAGGTLLPTQFNWEYPRPGERHGSVQYLLNSDGSYHLLDDPIRLAPIQLTTAGGAQKTYSLQFDGSWVNGLPDLWEDLRRAGFDVTPAIAAKVVSIPAGTEVVDASDPTKRYLFKPLAVAEYLTTIADPGGLDLDPAAALDLDAVPGFVEHGLGPTPDVPVKYSEGVLVR